MANYKIIGADLMEYGPVSAEQIRQWMAEGRVSSDTKLQAEGAREWTPLAEAPEFARRPSTAPPRFLHTCCQHCSGPIEFPEQGLETEISCPHCETIIRLHEGLSPGARGAQPRPADTVPKKEVSPETRVKVAEHVLAHKRGKEYSVVTLYLASGAGYLLLMLLFYWSGIIHPIRDLLPITAFGAFCALIVVGFHLYECREKKRIEGLANLAMRLGMQFTAEAPEGFLGRKLDGTIPPQALSDGINLSILRYGGRISNVMLGELDGVAISLFDYWYNAGSGRFSRVSQQTVAILSLPTLSLPAFVLKPEGLFHKVGSAFGMQDIDFPEAPGFSKQFLLRGARAHAVRAAFNRGVLEFFERHPGMSAEGSGRQLIYFRAGRLQPPAEVRGFMRQGCELARLLAH